VRTISCRSTSGVDYSSHYCIVRYWIRHYIIAFRRYLLPSFLPFPFPFPRRVFCLSSLRKDGLACQLTDERLVQHSLLAGNAGGAWSEMWSQRQRGEHRSVVGWALQVCCWADGIGRGVSRVSVAWNQSCRWLVYDWVGLVSCCMMLGLAIKPLFTPWSTVARYSSRPQYSSKCVIR